MRTPPKDHRGTYSAGKFHKGEALRAYHEAAHAVAYVRLGYRLDSVWIAPGTEGEVFKRYGVHGDIGGKCSIEIHRPDGEGHFVLTLPSEADHMLAAFAPGPAEGRLYRERGWRDSRSRSASANGDMLCSDYTEMVMALADDDPDQTDKIARMNQAQEAASAFVSDEANWRAITAVAMALLDTCVNQRKWGMNHDDVMAAIEGE